MAAFAVLGSHGWLPCPKPSGAVGPAWLALCLRLGLPPLPPPLSAVCGSALKPCPSGSLWLSPARASQLPSSAVFVAGARWAVQGGVHSFGLGAGLPGFQPRCQVCWPLAVFSGAVALLVGTREDELTQCARRAQAVLGERCLVSVGSGRASCPPCLLSFPRLPEGRAGQGQCSPAAPTQCPRNAEDPMTDGLASALQ